MTTNQHWQENCPRQGCNPTIATQLAVAALSGGVEGQK